MALKNYIAAGTYSIIDAQQYSKHHSWLRFYLKIFTDETKTVQLAEKFFEISGNQNYLGIGEDRKTPPENPKEGDSYFVYPTASGEWEGKHNYIAMWEERYDRWGYWGIGLNRIFYSISGDFYFVLDQNMEKVKVYPLDDIRLWDKWFTADTMFSSTTNMYRQCYDFLKTLPGFEKAVDC